MCDILGSGSGKAELSSRGFCALGRWSLRAATGWWLFACWFAVGRGADTEGRPTTEPRLVERPVSFERRAILGVLAAPPPEAQGQSRTVTDWGTCLCYNDVLFGAELRGDPQCGSQS